ncbi:MAG: low molecular weight phosphotyrosine protein phosphatase [Clostridiales bacterium]|jgi:protein-tyrosine phosphatase|nr:low molecular weight phosphotyrosine protein phosphatase [Clostridiales bacterium]
MKNTKILFVCLGNICRSPMAEAILRNKAEEAGMASCITADSAGCESYNVGNIPHRGTRKVLDNLGISYEGIIARKIKASDMDDFDLIIAMDEENMRDINRISMGQNMKKVCLFSKFLKNGKPKNIPDPWYSNNFDETYALINEGCANILEYLKANF